MAGEVASGGHLAGYLWKDEQKNQVVVLAEQRPGAKYVETAYEPLAVGKGLSLLQVDLLTGRAHQIRAHLAAIGHPVIGDFKYGDRKLNEKYRRRFQVTSQLLHACEITLTDGTVITAPYPPVFQTVLRYLRGKLKNGKEKRMATWNSRGLRGSSLEEFVNRTNETYAANGLALIRKFQRRSRPYGSTRRAVISRWLILTRRARWTISAPCRGFRSALTRRSAMPTPFLFRLYMNIRWTS